MILTINYNGTLRQFDIAQMSDISNIVADEYSASSTYAVGDLVLHNGTLYECTTAISTAEAWTAAHWDAVTLVDEIGKVIQTVPTPDWEAASGTSGYIDNKPNIKQGTDTNHTAVVEGVNTTASGVYSHAEGAGTQATGDYSHSEGGGSKATATYGHAEGVGTTASAMGGHSEGGGAQATASYSHAEGSGTVASGAASHSEGGATIASGSSAHSEGNNTAASGNYSHAEGSYTVANHLSQHVFGEYNIEDPSVAAIGLRGNYVEIVGNGSYNARSNARTLDWDGNEVLAGKLTVGSAPTNNMDVATKQYVDNSIVQEIFVGTTVPSGYSLYIDPEGSLTYAQGVSF